MRRAVNEHDVNVWNGIFLRCRRFPGVAVQPVQQQEEEWRHAGLDVRRRRCRTGEPPASAIRCVLGHVYERGI